MMRICLMVVLLVSVFGCTYNDDSLQSMISNPPGILQDPHFAQYQQERDALESQYLSKKISYPEYLDRKKRLDDKYTYDVKKRTQAIYGEDYSLRD